MKKIKFTCPSCNARLGVPSHLAGVTGPCPKCGHAITAPADVDEAMPVGATSAPLPASAPVQTAPAPAAAVTPAAPAAPVATTPPAPVHSPAPAYPAAPATAPSPAVVPAPAAVAPPQPAPAPAAPVTPPQPEPEQIVSPAPAPPVAPAPEPAQPLEPIDTIAPPTSVEPSPEPLPSPVVEPEPELPETPVPTEESGPQPKVSINVARVPAAPEPDPAPEIETAPEVDAIEAPAPVPLEDEIEQELGALLSLPDEPTGTSVLDEHDDLPRQFNIPEPQESAIPEAPAVPETQPIHVKATPTDLPTSQSEDDLDLPRLDVSLAENADLPGASSLVDQSAPTQLRLPDPDSEEEPSSLEAFTAALEDDQLELSALANEPEPEPELEVLPEPEPEAAEQSSDPVPVPISVPEENDEEVPEFLRTPSTVIEAPEEGGLPEPLVENEPLGLTEDQPVEEGPSTGAGTMANMLGANTSDAPKAKEKSADDVFNEILNPKSKQPKDKKKGLKASHIVMIAVFATVAILATVGVIMVVNAFGGGWDTEITRDDISGTKPKEVEVSGKDESAAAAIEAPEKVVNPLETLENAAEDTIDSLENHIAKVAENGGSNPYDGADGILLPKPTSPTNTLVSPDAGELGVVPPPIAAETPPAQPPLAVPAIPQPPTIPGPDSTANAAAASDTPAPDSFPAPAAEEQSLGQTREIIDAFVKAPSWEDRLKYIYQGESLRPTIEQYYQKMPDKTYTSSSLEFLQWESDVNLGGPYWVYIANLGDQDGIPIIVREEEGLLKIDWHVYAEFHDKHFVKFQQGQIPSPHTFRLVVHRQSDYFGPDREGFKDLTNYLVYKISTPYGDHEEWAFIKKGTQIANDMDRIMKLGDEPLAMIVTIENKAFSHGINHLMISKLVAEGWFN
ncbi:MAG: hypothetical protein AAF226_02300 [Verrucomicrobiota bacterium]